MRRKVERQMEARQDHYFLAGADCSFVFPAGALAAGVLAAGVLAAGVFPPGAAGTAAPAAASAPTSPSGFSSSLAFLIFLTTMRWTRTLGRPNGLRPSCQRSSF